MRGRFLKNGGNYNARRGSRERGLCILVPRAEFAYMQRGRDGRRKKIFAGALCVACTPIRKLFERIMCACVYFQSTGRCATAPPIYWPLSLCAVDSLSAFFPFYFVRKENFSCVALATLAYFFWIYIFSRIGAFERTALFDTTRVFHRKSLIFIRNFFQFSACTSFA